MTLDTGTIVNTVIAGLLLALVLGGVHLHARVIKLQAEFRAFRFEVLRFMEAQQGD